MEKKKENQKRYTITFNVGSKELKEEAIELARNFQPVRISLSSLCQLALREYVEKNKK